MPFRKGARMTVTNEGTQTGGIVLLQHRLDVDRQLPADAMYFHAQYRQAAPTQAMKYATPAEEKNPDGKQNHVYCETRGRGHLMGVTLGVVQNASAGWAKATT